ncbi:MAG: hypothetical protein FJ312_10295 [SAR202 cluster bacterium]|nr:hypothetical protein [SAR202 cluster bacterium]
MGAHGSFALPRQRIACVLVTHLPAKAELRRNADLVGKPFIITQGTGSKQAVLDYSSEVRGIVAGMPLQEALSRCNGVRLVQADEPYYQRVFQAIVDALLQRSPVVEKADLGCAYVGLSGLEAMYGGEARLASALLSAVPSDLRPRVGIATGKFPAYIAATFGEPGRAVKVPDDVAGFLHDRSADLLPVSWKVKERLHTHGLHLIGQVVALGVGPLQAQFGSEGRRMWELACGVDASLLVPFKQEETVSEYMAFPTPSVSLPAVLVGVESLVGRAFSQPTLRGRSVRKTLIEAHLMGDNPPWVRDFVFKEPVSSKERAYAPLKAMFEVAKLPAPLEDMRLTLMGLTGDKGLQSSLLMDVRRHDQLRESFAQLAVRLRKEPPIFYIRDAERDSIVPESRRVLVPVGHSTVRAVNEPVPVEVWRDLHGRPTDVVMGRDRIPVASILDTWEVNAYWWRPSAVARRYWRIVLDSGDSFDVFHDPATGQWHRQRY